VYTFIGVRGAFVSLRGSHLSMEFGIVYTFIGARRLCFVAWEPSVNASAEAVFAGRMTSR
jgi:hypothetical protein